MNVHEKLDALVETYSIDTLSEQFKRLEFLEKLRRHVDLSGLYAVELGSASGRLTQLLAKACRRVTAVDGSARFIEIARETVMPLDVDFKHSMFESFLPDVSPDLVVMHHILEHVDDPVSIMGGIRSYLKPDGILAITVPNAHALSRQLAVKMGLLQSVYELTQNDHHHGHQRVYDWQAMRRDATSAGYEIVAEHGLALKLFADFQNERMVEVGVLGEAQFHGLWKLADDYRDLSGAIMMVLRPAFHG